MAQWPREREVRGSNPETIGQSRWVGIKLEGLGSGCGTVGSAVASDTRNPRFESRHRHKLIYNQLYCVCWKKWKERKKRSGWPTRKNGHLEIETLWVDLNFKARTDCFRPEAEKRWYQIPKFELGNGNFPSILIANFYCPGVRTVKPQCL